MIKIMVIGDDGEVQEREVVPLWQDIETGEVYTPDMIDWDAMDMDGSSLVWGSF